MFVRVVGKLFLEGIIVDRGLVREKDGRPMLKSMYGSG